MFKAKKNASKRTKNRFREHTLILDGDRVSETVSGFIGRKCILFASIEPTEKGSPFPRWMGWLPIDEIQNEFCGQCEVRLNDDDFRWCGESTSICRECKFEQHNGVASENMKISVR
tara:strand:- start:107 stop:454 length:348 start_codon:yes stop_codon:yes gene_type:complete